MRNENQVTILRFSVNKFAGKVNLFGAYFSVSNFVLFRAFNFSRLKNVRLCNAV